MSIACALKENGWHLTTIVLHVDLISHNFGTAGLLKAARWDLRLVTLSNLLLAIDGGAAFPLAAPARDWWERGF